MLRVGIMLKRIFYLFLFACLIVSFAGCNHDEKTATTKSDQSDSAKEEKNIEEEEQTVSTSPSEDEQIYHDTYKKLYNTFCDDFDKLIKLTKEADTDNSLFQDKNWQDEFNASLLKIVILNGMLEDMEKTNNVPELYTKVHETTIDITNLVIEGANYVRDGGLNNDYDTVNNGITILSSKELQYKFDELSGELKKVKKLRSFE